jgi:hypothetical protein
VQSIWILRHLLSWAWGTRWRSWLRHYITSQKVASMIPDGVNEIFHWHNPSGLTEISTRNISWEVKAAGAWGWQPYHLHKPTVLKSGSLNLLEPSGPVQACNGIALLYLVMSNMTAPMAKYSQLCPDITYSVGFSTLRDQLYAKEFRFIITWKQI